MKTLQDWLSHLETAHSSGLIDMGLERVGEVKKRMNFGAAMSCRGGGGYQWQRFRMCLFVAYL